MRSHSVTADPQIVSQWLVGSGVPLALERVRATWPPREQADIDALAAALDPRLSPHPLALLTGPWGVGKSQAAVELLRRWLASAGPRPVRYWSLNGLLAAEKATFGGPARRVNEWGSPVPSPIEAAKTCRFLILDECDKVAPSAWADTSVYDMINERAFNALPTLLLGNIQPDKIAGTLGVSLCDRLNESGAVVVDASQWARKRGLEVRL